MKILVVSQCFYPETFRINELCFNLVNEGHSVTVLTGYPNYPEGYIYPEYKDKKIKRETINGVDVIRVNMSERKTGSARLFLNYVTYALSAGFKTFSLDKDYDAVFVFQTSPVTQILPAWLYKVRCKKPIAVNCQDIWPDVVKVRGLKEGTLIFNMVKAASAWLYKRADIIVNTSPGFANYLNTVCGIEPSKMLCLPSFAEDFYLEFGNKSAEDNRLHLLFAGNIGQAQNLDTVVGAVAKLNEEKRKQLMIDILGDGSYLEELKGLVEQNALSDCFTFHGRKPATELRDYYELADGYLLTLEGNSPLSLTIPAKLQGYMGAGKPILAAINGGAADVIADADCGRRVPAGDAEGLAGLMEEMLASNDHFASLGENGKIYFINNFTLDKYTKDLIKILEELK
ncbi:MAG: glycosyltransferase family 4 protein [Clostridia bacterium]|nr:glycosyltransferase family 4 protein [Clostridia bacterium]